MIPLPEERGEIILRVTIPQWKLYVHALFKLTAAQLRSHSLYCRHVLTAVLDHRSTQPQLKWIHKEIISNQLMNVGSVWARCGSEHPDMQDLTPLFELESVYYVLNGLETFLHLSVSALPRLQHLHLFVVEHVVARGVEASACFCWRRLEMLDEGCFDWPEASPAGRPRVRLMTGALHRPTERPAERHRCFRRASIHRSTRADIISVWPDAVFDVHSAPSQFLLHVV